MLLSKNSYVTQEYDFYTAITKNIDLSHFRYKNFRITEINHVFDNAAIVKTTHGNFYCETWGDDLANTFMRVSDFL